MTVGDAILSLVDKLLVEREKVVRLELSREHMVGRVGFTACSISYIKKVCVFTGTHTITSLTVGIKHFYL